MVYDRRHISRGPNQTPGVHLRLPEHSSARRRFRPNPHHFHRRPPRIRYVLDHGAGDWTCAGSRLCSADPGGKEYVPQWLRYNLDHPRWTGFSAWDMIMPLFLFIVRVAMPFFIGRRLEQGASRSDIYFKALRRVMLLWILGMIHQGNLLDFRLDHLRLYSNTLQSIAAGYLIATIVLVELRNWRWQIALTAGLLVLYWACMAFIPFHGHRGEYTEQGNLGILLDKAILNGRNYHWIVGGAIAAAVAIVIIAAGTWRTSSARLSQKLLATAVVAGLVVWMLIAAFGVDRTLVFDFQDRTTYAWILAGNSFVVTGI